MYSGLFESAWKVYGRGEEKPKAFEAWRVAAAGVGGEAALLALVLEALEWQTPNLEIEGWRYAPYFERYLKNARWTDRRPLAPVAPRLPEKIQQSRSAAFSWLEKQEAKDHGR